MLTPENAATDGREGADLAERLRAATDFLELIAANRGLLAEVSQEDRRRFLDATAHVYSPDAKARRKLVKATIRLRKAARVQRDESELNETGIRQLRKQTVFTTPNVFPPPGFSQEDVEDDPDFREAVEPQCCYVCKQHYTAIHPFYDQLCPTCAEFNFFKRTETGRPARPGGAAHRRPGEDRLPGGDQAAAGRGAPDRHDALPARLGDALRRRAGLRGVGRPAGDLRARPAAHAERRGVLPPAGGRTGPARLHHQQRVPDGAAAARVLPPHDGAGDGVGGATAGAGAPAAGRVRGLARRQPAAGRRRGERRPRPSHRRCPGPEPCRGAVAGAAAAGGARRCRTTSSRRGGSTRTCSRWTCAGGTPGGC